MPVIVIFAAIAFMLGMLVGVLAMWWFDKGIFNDMRKVIRDRDKRIEMLTADLEIAIEMSRHRDVDIMGIEEEGDY